MVPTDFVQAHYSTVDGRNLANHFDKTVDTMAFVGLFREIKSFCWVS